MSRHDAEMSMLSDYRDLHIHCRALSLAEAGGMSSSGYDSEGGQAQDTPAAASAGSGTPAANAGPPTAQLAEAAASTAHGSTEPPAPAANGSARGGDDSGASGAAELAPAAQEAAAEDAGSQPAQGSGTLQQSPAALPGVLETGQADADSAAAAALPGGSEVSLQHWVDSILRQHLLQQRMRSQCHKGVLAAGVTPVSLVHVHAADD
jgi:hypothetical protein